MAYSKTIWNTGDVITKEKLNKIEDGIEGIELTPGPQGPAGEKGDTGAQGPKGDKGDTGAQGPAGKNAKEIKTIVINTDATDKVTGGVLTYTDETTVNITINIAGG